MNTLRNSVRLIGNLGAAPEVKNLDNGNKMARLNLATNETYMNSKGEKVTETSWHNLVAWGKTAEIAEKYLDKGREVAVEGKLTSRSYTDKEGNKKYITEVVINEILMLDKKIDKPHFTKVMFQKRGCLARGSLFFYELNLTD